MRLDIFVFSGNAIHICAFFCESQFLYILLVTRDGHNDCLIPSQLLHKVTFTAAARRDWHYVAGQSFYCMLCALLKSASASLCNAGGMLQRVVKSVWPFFVL